ncbi:MAG: 8-oxo-dGDP phosphatase, partial [Ilumatobacteraceae bacterium]
MSSPPAFRHLGDRLVHQGYIWHVAVATFEAPGGELFERDVVRSPGAVGVVPLLFEDGVPTVVFVRQYRGPLDQYLLEIPAGMRDVP